VGRRLRSAACVGAGLAFSWLGHAPAAQAKTTAAEARQIAGLQKELDAAEQELSIAEDVSAIRKLQRAYGFFLDKGMWEDLSQLFTDDARADYPAGVYIGKASIREHVWRNVGDGAIGLRDGRIYNHMVMQPVIDVAPDGKSAKGRWRVLAMIGRLGSADGKTPGQANWAGGVYENAYVKDNGVWKIKDLRYYDDFSSGYEGGWAKVNPVTPGVPPPPPAPRRFALAKAPDQPRAVACPGYPYACIQPFHYVNPVTGRETKP
jgi:hypothetical protein